MAEFKPSLQSMTTLERTVATLRYLQKAAEEIERKIVETGEVPPWVLDRIQRGAVNLGMAASYAQKKKSKKETKP